MFTVVSSDVPGYDFSLVMILDQIFTGKRYLPVHYWVTVVLLTPLLCVRNVGHILSEKCMYPLMFSSASNLLYNLMSNLRRTRVCLFSPLSVVEYSHDFMLKKKAPTVSCPMAVLRWE